MGQGSGRCCTEGVPDMGAHPELLGSASTLLWLPLCHGGQTCRGGAAGFLVLHGILEIYGNNMEIDIIYLRYGRHIAFTSKLCFPWLSYRHGKFLRSDLVHIEGSWGSQAMHFYSRAAAPAKLSGVMSSREVNPISGIGESWNMQDFLLPLVFWVKGCETSFHFCFSCPCLVAMHLWCGVLQSGDFPIKFGFVSLIFTRDEQAITSGQSRHVAHQGREIQEK